nr:phage tail tape measure protein [Bacillus licheniformis]
MTSQQTVAKTKELERQLELYRRQAQVNTQNLQNRYGDSLSNASNQQLQQYLNSVNQLTARTPNLRNQMASLNMQFREMSSNIAATTRQTMGFVEQLGVVAARIPVWFAGMTMFMGPIRGLQSMVDQVIQIDTLMTEIRRVMDEPDYKFNDMLQEAVEMGDQLSNKISDILQMTSSFGRMGFDETELGSITKTAEVLQNVSNLSVDETVNTLTSAMLNFNVAAEDSISIAD